MLIAACLAGCAETPAALADKAATFAIDSAKSSKQLATCIADHLRDAQLRNDGDHYTVLRSGPYGTFSRWDIEPNGSGSRAELRKVKISGAEAQIGKDCQ